MNKKMELPQEIEWNIIKFMSHPIAEIIKNSYEFKFAKWKNDRIHGCPFDRGESDAYYGRDYTPHRWTNGNGRNGGTVYDLTDEEELEYEAGFFSMEERK